MKKQIKGIFFDLFGTLLIYGDMRSAWAEWLTEFHSALRQHGLLLSEDDFAKKCDRFFGKDAPPEMDNNYTVFERRIRALSEDLGLKIEHVEVTRIANHIAGIWQRHIELDREAKTTLYTLQKGKTLGLMTNFDHPPHVRRIMRDHQLDDYFKSIVISGDIGIKKPDPGIFEMALMQTNMQPCEVVYVGDTDEDIVGARAAGITPILIRRDGIGTDLSALDFTEETSAELPESFCGVDSDVMHVASLSQLLSMFD